MSEMTFDTRVELADCRLTWKVLGVLMIGALLGAVGMLPYVLTLSGSALQTVPLPLWQVLALHVVWSLILAAAAASLGLWLGGKVGLGAPVLRAWLAGEPDASSRFRSLLLPASVAGAVSAIAILALELGLFAPRLPITEEIVSGPPPWQGFLVSFYGGINEELLLRLGVMTLFVWVGAKLTRMDRPAAGVMWTANVLAALLFGLGHLPATAAIMPLTALVVTRALVLNGLAGVVFGWLYWRRGLLAAMVAHFSADIVLHVLTPLALG